MGVRNWRLKIVFLKNQFSNAKTTSYVTFCVRILQNKWTSPRSSPGLSEFCQESTVRLIFLNGGVWQIRKRLWYRRFFHSDAYCAALLQQQSVKTVQQASAVTVGPSWFADCDSFRRITWKHVPRPMPQERFFRYLAHHLSLLTAVFLPWSVPFIRCCGLVQQNSKVENRGRWRRDIDHGCAFCVASHFFPNFKWCRVKCVEERNDGSSPQFSFFSIKPKFWTP